MKATRAILSELNDARERHVYARRFFTSKTTPPVEYQLRVFYGGSMDKPNIECSCPRFTFERWCGHAEHTWNNDLDYIARRMCVERDEIYKRFSWQ